MTKGYGSRWALAVAGTLAFLVVPGWVAAQDESKAKAAMVSAEKDLAGIRNELAKRLEARLKDAAAKGDSSDVFLRLQEGVDEQQAFLTARRRGGVWEQAYLTVPAWHLETMNEKRNNDHRNGVGLNAPDKFRFPVNMGGVTLDANGLNGRMDALVRLNQTREERLPPGTPLVFHTGEVFSWMDRWVPLVHQKLRCQAFELKAQGRPGRTEFDLVFRKAISGNADFYLRFRMPEDQWLRPTPWTPTFNAGYHDGDTSGLTYKDGVLSGIVKVTINPDKWFPKSPIKMQLKVEGKLEDGFFKGRYEATEGATPPPGVVEGRGGTMVDGFFSASGDLGKYDSLVSGFVSPARQKIMPLLEADLAAADTGDTYARLFTLFRQVRALSMADAQYPLPIEEALRQARVLRPAWTTNEVLSADEEKAMAAHAGEMVKWAKSALDKEPLKGLATGMPEVSDPRFGPFYGLKPLDAVASGGAWALPPDTGKAGPQKWSFVPEWQAVGPLDVRSDMDDNLSALPDLVPGDGGMYALNARLLSKEEQPKAGQAKLRGWTKQSAAGGRLMFPWAPLGGRGALRGSVTFARTTIEAPKNMELWVSVAAKDYAKMWVNGRLTWVADEQSWAQRGTEEAVMKVSLKKGANEVFFRLREDRSDCWLKFAVCVQGAPRAAEVASAQDGAMKAALPPPVAAGKGGADPLLGWDINSGKNIAWKQPLPARLRAGPVAAAGRLFMSWGYSTVACMDQATGKIQWQAELNALELGDKTISEQWGKASDAERKQILTGAKLDWDYGRDSIAADGDTVCVYHRSGVLAAYATDGKRKWMVKTDRSEPWLVLVEGKVILVTQVRAGKDISRRAVALDPADGKELWNVTCPERYPIAGVLRVPAIDKPLVALLFNDRVLDIATGRSLLEGLDIDASSEGFDVLVANDMLFMTQLLRRNAVRFFVDGDGQLGYRHAWDSRYVTKEMNTVYTACAADRWLLTAGTVGEDRPGHSPVSLGEIEIHDRVTGEPAGRIKPVFRGGRMQWSRIAVAGSYAYVPDEGGSQMAVLHVPAEGVPYLISTNFVEAGTRSPSLNDGRMFLVSASIVYAVSADSAEGKAFQDEQVARFVLDRVGYMEGSGAPDSRFKALPARPDAAKVPLTRMGDEPGIINWLYAGPFPASDDPKFLDGLAGMTAEDGQELDVAGAKLRFAPLPYANTVLSCISFSYHLLEGFGMQVIAEERKVAAGSVAGTNAGQSVVFHTVVANSKPRYVSVVGPDAACRMWFGGRPIKSAISLHLDAGYYPLTLKIDTAALAASPLARVAFTIMGEPGEVKRARVARFSSYVPWLEKIAAQMPGTPYAKRAERALADLADARGIADSGSVRRSLRNDGSGRFDLGCIPVPLSKELNLKWTADASKAGGCDPVADAGYVFAAGSAPAAILAFDAGTGKEAWSSPVAGAKEGEMSAPAVNNGRVCAVSANGAAQCCAMDGKTLWTKAIPKARTKTRPIVLAADDVFVVQCGMLAAVDAATGEVRWQRELGKGAEAAPVLARIGPTAVVLASDGTAVRVADGALLCGTLPKGGAVAMQADGRRVYACDGAAVTALALPSFAERGEAWPVLWNTRLAAKVVCQPVAVGGKLYVLTGKQLTVLDAGTGTEVASEKVDATDASSLTLAGDRLIAANAGKENRTVVFGILPALAVRTEIGATEPLAALSFAKGLAVTRAGTALYGIGGGDPAPPETLVEPEKVSPPAGFDPAKDAAVVPFSDNDVPLQWVVSEPFPKSGLDVDCLAAVGGEAKAAPGASTKVKFGDKEYGFGPVPQSAFWRSAKFTSGLDAMTVPKAISATNACTAYLATVIDVPVTRYVRFELLVWVGKNWPNTNDCNLSVWMSGRRIESGGILVLDKGRHPVTVRADQGHVGGGNIYIAPRFVDLTDSFAEMKARNEKQKALWEAFQKAGAQRVVLGK